MTRIGIGLRNHYDIVCRDRDGKIKWQEAVTNLTTNAGLDEMLDKFWRGTAYTASHFIGLTASAPAFVAGDTMASHIGWNEATNYGEASRPALTLGSVAGQAVSNGAARASFSIAAPGTVGGSFIVTDATKGGAAGILMGGSAFAGGDRAVATGDTIDITVTLTAASA